MFCTQPGKGYCFSDADAVSYTHLDVYKRQILSGCCEDVLKYSTNSKGGPRLP